MSNLVICALLLVAVWAVIYFSPAGRDGVLSLPSVPPPPPIQLPRPGAFPNALVVRPYRTEDRPACVAIYGSNAGEFVPPDQELFLQSIDQETGVFLVIELEGRVVACGGITMRPEERQAWLWMGLVERAHHRRGLGTPLLLSRLALLKDDPTLVVLETTQKTEPLYAKFGFSRASEPEQRYRGDLAHFYMLRSTGGAERDQIRAFLGATTVCFDFEFDTIQSRTSLAELTTASSASPQAGEKLDRSSGLVSHSSGAQENRPNP